MGGLTFTEAAARRLETLYLTRDVVAQRSETIRQLTLSPGERVLDVGCGPGYLCENMADIVGQNGTVVGIDISHDPIALCGRRTQHPWLTYAVGDATRIAAPDASFDAVVCTQVAEYVPDVDRVLAEAFRVLRLGGRAVFIATDWAAVIWHSDNPERMHRVMRAWESHCAHAHLPRSLPSRLRRSGFQLDDAGIFPILNLQWEDQAYSKGLAGLVQDFVRQKNELAPAQLQEWYDEFAPLSQSGRYFFSSNRCIFRASKLNAWTASGAG
jgi:arsenite methyltransferase